MGVYRSHRQRRCRFRDSLEPVERQALLFAAALFVTGFVMLMLVLAPVIWDAM